MLFYIFLLLVEKVFVIFGGIGKQLLNDVYILDPYQQEWYIILVYNKGNRL